MLLISSSVHQLLLCLAKNCFQILPQKGLDLAARGACGR
jgi:hypothetical protein